MFSKTSYDTTCGNIFPIHKTEAAIKEAMIASDLCSRSLGIQPIGDCRAVFLLGINAVEDKIRPFSQPIVLQHKGVTYVVSDVRAYASRTKDWMTDGEFERGVRNKTEYFLKKTRAVMELQWVAGNIERLRPKFKFAGSVYAAWITQAINRVYALDMHDQARISAIALYFYYTRFVDENKLTGHNLDIASNHSIKLTGLPAGEVYNIFENLPELPNVEAFCACLYGQIENVRLAHFDAAVLFTAVSTSYYGDDASDSLKIALEYPPAWIAIVVAVLMERGYKSSPLYKVIEMQSRRGAGDEFKMQYLTMTKQVVLALETSDNETVDIFDVGQVEEFSESVEPEPSEGAGA